MFLTVKYTKHCLMSSIQPQGYYTAEINAKPPKVDTVNNQYRNNSINGY